MKIYKFKDCYLDAFGRKVFLKGRQVELTPRAFDILQLLVERAGEIVTKEELIEKIWRGCFVEEGNIPVHISKLRKTFGVKRSEPFIETVSGVGYQFAARVSAVGAKEWEKLSGQNGGKSAKVEPLGAAIDSIAVLPFQSAGENREIEYLAEGLTETLINNLSQFAGIRVIARNTVFRFKDSAADAREIGAMLGVALTLTGRVKTVGENAVVSVELIKTADGAQFWGGRFYQKLSDVFEIQEKIADAVSEKLRLQISDLAQKRAPKLLPANVEAYTPYLKGRYFWARKNVADVNLAIKHFQTSISLDPDYAPSCVGLADCYMTLFQLEIFSRNQALALIKTSLDRASEIDENNSEVLAMQGWIKIMFEWDWENAERFYQKALAINPNSIIARTKYANLLALKGSFDESLFHLHQALLLDPLSPHINAFLGRVFFFMEQFDNAISQLRETLELDPQNYLASILLGVSLVEKGEFKAAMDIRESK